MCYLISHRCLRRLITLVKTRKKLLYCCNFLFSSGIFFYKIIVRNFVYLLSVKIYTLNCYRCEPNYTGCYMFLVTNHFNFLNFFRDSDINSSYKFEYFLAFYFLPFVSVLLTLITLLYKLLTSILLLTR